MNVIQLAKNQAAIEANSSTRAHASAHRGARGPILEEGELVWYGDHVDVKETKPCILANGDKRPMTKQEAKLFARTPYERGVTEYRYEGTLRRLRPAEDAQDPRAAHREGQGVMRYPTGEMFEGQWKANKRHGEGFMSTPLGYRYTGEWKDDDLDGKGYETLPCKSAFDCNFVDGVPEGTGVLLYVPHINNAYRYEGEFKLGHRHGKGTIFYENGDTYVGTWDNGRRHGKGITTRDVNGKQQQYITEWDQGELVYGPEAVEKAKRQSKPKSQLKVREFGNLVPADLTKWKVKEDVTDLPLDHFLRIKLGFEKLDTSRGGSLSTGELQAIWGDGSQAMLQKLDADNNGTVELDEIFAAWYPNVPPHNVSRFLQQDINPKVLLRLRGYLCGVVDVHDCGYFQVVGIKPANYEQEEDRALTMKHIENANYKIGMEKFTVAMYEAARQLCDPPHFFELLSTWYQNIPRVTLERYELRTIPPADLEAIKKAFFALSSNEMTVQISDFEDAQTAFQEGKEPSGPIESGALPGFFHEQPIWQVGPIRLSVQLLRDIDKFDQKSGGAGSVSLLQLLRYCYPNVRCKRTQELLLGNQKKNRGTSHCSCEICAIA